MSLSSRCGSLVTVDYTNLFYCLWHLSLFLFLLVSQKPVTHARILSAWRLIENGQSDWSLAFCFSVRKCAESRTLRQNKRFQCQARDGHVGPVSIWRKRGAMQRCIQGCRCSLTNPSAFFSLDRPGVKLRPLKFGSILGEVVFQCCLLWQRPV